MHHFNPIFLFSKYKSIVCFFLYFIKSKKNSTATAENRIKTSILSKPNENIESFKETIILLSYKIPFNISNATNVLSALKKVHATQTSKKVVHTLILRIPLSSNTPPRSTALFLKFPIHSSTTLYSPCIPPQTM